MIFCSCFGRKSKNSSSPKNIDETKREGIQDDSEPSNVDLNQLDFSPSQPQEAEERRRVVEIDTSIPIQNNEDETPRLQAVTENDETSNEIELQRLLAKLLANKDVVVENDRSSSEQEPDGMQRMSSTEFIDEARSDQLHGEPYSEEHADRTGIDNEDECEKSTVVEIIERNDSLLSESAESDDSEPANIWTEENVEVNEIELSFDPVEAEDLNDNIVDSCDVYVDEEEQTTDEQRFVIADSESTSTSKIRYNDDEAMSDQDSITELNEDLELEIDSTDENDNDGPPKKEMPASVIFDPIFHDSNKRSELDTGNLMRRPVRKAPEPPVSRTESHKQVETSSKSTSHPFIPPPSRPAPVPSASLSRSIRHEVAHGTLRSYLELRPPPPPPSPFLP